MSVFDHYKSFGENLFSTIQKSCCTVLTQELSQRLRMTNTKGDQETSDKNKA